MVVMVTFKNILLSFLVNLTKISQWTKIMTLQLSEYPLRALPQSLNLNSPKEKWRVINFKKHVKSKIMSLGELAGETPSLPSVSRLFSLRQSSAAIDLMPSLLSDCTPNASSVGRESNSETPIRQMIRRSPKRVHWFKAVIIWRQILIGVTRDWLMPANAVLALVAHNLFRISDYFYLLDPNIIFHH